MADQTNTDAQFRFAMSEDGMKLGVSRYFPPDGGEGPSVELLKRQVAEAGVTLPVDESAAKQVINAIHRDGEIRRIVLVRGIPAKEPRNASLVALGNLDNPVFAGDRFARLHPPQEAEEGQTIDGRPLKPKEHFEPESIEVKMGDNVELDPVTNSYVSQVWGMARLKEGVISVDPIPHISEDAVKVTGNIHGKDFRSQDITPAAIEKELHDLGVVIDINLDALDEKLRRARQSSTPLIDQVLVEGKYPIPGRDGYLEYLVSTREARGTEDESGRLDFRDRGAYPMVEAGQRIGRLHPPTQGQGGIDIYGKTIPASAGKELHVHLGENVAVLDDKVTFEATAKGVMSMDKGVLSVSDCLVISGNVDMSTGNVKLEHGSVRITGSVHAGFSVSAPKNVIVMGSVESATVYAGTNVEVAGGILMPDGGRITAEGDVLAGYTTNARIDAGGNVEVANDVTNSTIRCEGTFTATRGKGHIQGGRIKAGKGITCNEAGSELGVATTLAVTIERAEDEELRQERQKIKQAIQKIDETLGKEDPRCILERTAPEKRAAVAEVLKHRITLVKRRKAISEQLNQLALKHQEELRGVRIKALRLMHPGTTLMFGAKSRTVSTRREASAAYWDDRNREIVFAD